MPVEPLVVDSHPHEGKPPLGDGAAVVRSISCTGQLR